MNLAHSTDYELVYDKSRNKFGSDTSRNGSLKDMNNGHYVYDHKNL
jgi:hypothetical protein